MFLTVITVKNIKIYYLENQANHLPIFSKNTETKTAEYLQKLNTNQRVIFMTEPYFSTEWCLFPFQRPDLYLISLNENDPIPNITGPKSFVVWADYEARLKEIMSLY